MNFGLFDLIEALGALGFFIYGMKVMSEGIQKAAGDQLKQVQNTMTRNRFLGVLSGFLITLLVQSSSATTVMTVSFVNAGLLSLLQSAGIVMGANIGTTVTAWMVSFFGFKVNIAAMSLPIIAVALPMLFVRKGNWRFWAEFLIGFALLFLGLKFLKDSVPEIDQHPEILEFLRGFANLGYLSYFIFILIGTFITIIVQSSSASMTITLVLVAKGWITFDVAAALVLGENIGTTVTAELAALVGNVHAKRAARIHSMFNVIGVTWMMLLFPFFLQLVDIVLISLGFQSPLLWGLNTELDGFTAEELHTRETAVTYGLSTFHTIFNVTNMLMLVWFAPQLARLAEKMIKPKDEEDEKFNLEYIGSGVTASVELSLMEAQKEISHFGNVVFKMMNTMNGLILEKNPGKIKKRLKKIQTYEDISDQMELAVGQYLIKISETELSEKSSLKIRTMLSIINDLERGGDVIYQMSRTFERKVDAKIWFTPSQREKVLELFEKVKEAFVIMEDILEKDYSTGNLTDIQAVENEIDELHAKFRKQHLKSIEKGDYNIKAGLIYVDLLSSAEKLGDHIHDVCKAAKGDSVRF